MWTGRPARSSGISVPCSHSGTSTSTCSTSRHPKKRGDWVSAKYWHLETGKWIFASKDGMTLYQHSETRVRRHVKVRGDKSPYDGDWVYWSTRLGTHPEVSKRVATLLKRQKGRCAGCGLYFTTDGDLPEIDHITPKHLGGIDAYFNLQLLHRHCHDTRDLVCHK